MYKYWNLSRIQYSTHPGQLRQKGGSRVKNYILLFFHSQTFHLRKDHYFLQNEEISFVGSRCSYLMFGPIVKFIGFLTQLKICATITSKTDNSPKKCLNNMIFAHLQILLIQKSCEGQNFDFSSIFEILAIQISKNLIFQIWPFFESKNAKILKKKSKIQKSGLYKFFVFLNDVTRPKISNFYWLLKPEINLKGLFFIFWLWL